MVKVGIIGAETKIAGEIIRILINHPETEIVSLFSPSNNGRSVSSIHHGLIGEIPLSFTDKIDLNDIDFLVITEETPATKQIFKSLQGLEELKTVVLSYIKKPEDIEFEIGLSEINRKALVRGARNAYIPSPAIVPALIALVPLANYMLLLSGPEIQVSLPIDISEKSDENLLAKQIEDILKNKQASFNGNVKLTVLADHDSERTLYTKIRLENSLPIEEIEKIYDQLYDDHNFTFITHNDISGNEVEGSQKNVIKIYKPEPDLLEIEAVADARLRGGAGDVIHVMNLFFGLHEKTGLHLKTSKY